jgi:hypothetical protein
VVIAASGSALGPIAVLMLALFWASMWRSGGGSESDSFG